MAKRSPISRRQANQSSEEDSSEESGGVSSSEEDVKDVTDIDVEVFTQPGPAIRNGRQRRQRNKRQVVSGEESDESNGIR